MTEYVRLGDVFDLQMGKTPSRNNLEYWNGGYNKWVSIADLSSYNKYVEDTKEKITMLGVEESGIKSVPPNTVLMSFKLSIGKTAITKDKVYTNEAIMAFIPKNNKLFNVDYLYYLLSNYRWTKGANKAVMGITLNKKTLQEYSIPCPPLSEQQHIVKTLDTASAVIEKRKKQIALLDDLAKSVFVEMFGDPIENPKGWEMIELSKLGDWASGGTPSRNNPEYFKGDIDWYSAGELNSVYLHSSIEKITKNGLEDSSAKLFKNGSILIGMYDTAAFKMGILTKDSSSNQACANLNPNKLINILWLYSNLNLMKSIFLLNRRGIRQKNLNLSMIKEFKIPLPPIELQKEFADRIEKIEKQRILLERGLAKIEEAYGALMQKYFG